MKITTIGRKIDRDYETKKQLAHGLAVLSKTRSAVSELAESYDGWIDDSARLGEDAYSDKLIEEKINLLELGRILSFLEVKIRTNAIKAKTLMELSCLNDITKACQSLLETGPDFKKLAAGLSALDMNLEKASSPIKQLCAELSGDDTSEVDALFGKPRKTDPKLAQKIEEEKKAREPRLGLVLANEAPTPADAGVSADIDTISAMIEAENRR